MSMKMGMIPMFGIFTSSIIRYVLTQEEFLCFCIKLDWTSLDLTAKKNKCIFLLVNISHEFPANHKLAHSISDLSSHLVPGIEQINNSIWVCGGQRTGPN